MTSAPPGERDPAPSAEATRTQAVEALEGVELRASVPADDAERDAFVERAPDGTFFHLAGWGRVVQRVFHHRRQDLVAVRDGAIVGVLPMMRCPGFFGLLGKPSLISMPYGVYGGPCASEPAISHALVRAAMKLAEVEQVGRLELRCREDIGLELPASDLYATFAGPLPEKPEEALASMPKKSRAEARKARNKHGLRLSEGIWYLDDLYRLFQLNKRNLGSPALPHAMFHFLWREFGDRVHVHLVHRERQPLAAVMTFLWRDTVMAYYAGTVPGADREFSASNFMYMALREWSIEQGFRHFDFGRSRKDSGAFRFKQHQGFEGQDLHYRYHLIGNAELPSFTPSNPKTKLLREVWSKLPLTVTKRLSSPLARYLP